MRSTLRRVQRTEARFARVHLWNRRWEGHRRAVYRLAIWHGAPSTEEKFQRIVRPSSPSRRNSIDLNETFVSIILGCRLGRADRTRLRKKQYPRFRSRIFLSLFFDRSLLTFNLNYNVGKFRGSIINNRARVLRSGHGSLLLEIVQITNI